MIGEHASGFRLGQNRGQFAQGLAHQTGLHAHRGHAHLAFEFRFRHQGGHRVDDNHVQSIRAGKGFANRQGLFAAVGLGYKQVLKIHPEPFGITRIQRVLGIDECSQPSAFLSIGNNVKHERGLAGRFRSKNLHHPASRQAADTQRQVQAQRARGYDSDFFERLSIA